MEEPSDWWQVEGTCGGSDLTNEKPGDLLEELDAVTTHAAAPQHEYLDDMAHEEEA